MPSWVLALLCVPVAFGAVGWWVRKALVVVTVEGMSMWPTFSDGDRVLVRRRPVGAVATGDVVVVDSRTDYASLDPTEVWCIKRAAAVPGDPVPRDRVPALRAATTDVVPPDSLVLLGDNAAASYDSRAVGYYPARGLLGVVLRRMPRPANGLEPRTAPGRPDRA